MHPPLAPPACTSKATALSSLTAACVAPARSDAQSPRWDVQEAYRSIFFAGQSPTKADADSPRAATGQAQDEYEEQLMEEWKIRQHNFSSMVARHSKSDDQTRARLQRADVIERLRRKFRVLAYRLGGQDWQSIASSMLPSDDCDTFLVTWENIFFMDVLTY